ncbi:alpha/beta hydrolase [Yangia mangrovi]|uniref:Alpha/beta hydrolase n=2 Tax=Alloyangia mangrovi TaxID=1779329 RepID=A0ABT2KFA0_9RHOB|nr:alpha/beta hydrolase [Alloyangia mangrovi]MCT4369030.1 alpha/beta hydrolase [Alloyangia mangrovi]
MVYLCPVPLDYLSFNADAPVSAPTSKGQTMELTQDWDKTFPKSYKVDHQKVTFTNRYGITLAGDLYTPKAEGPFAAIAVSGPFGAVKEQSSGLHAQTLAERGFVTLAFDASYTGESGGQPRDLASPEINTEDFSAAVDFLGMLAGVDRERIGILGICGFGGMGLNVAAADPRIKAVAATTMYDISRMMSQGYFDSTTKQQRIDGRKALNAQRWADAEAGTAAYGPTALQNLPEDAPQFAKEYAAYYTDENRGFHARSVNSNGSWTLTTPLSFMNMPLLTYIDEIAPRPVLLVHGSAAHSLYFSETAYSNAAEPKELFIVKDATHTDLSGVSAYGTSELISERRVSG